MPLARWANETVRITVFALVGFALLNWAAKRWNVPGLNAALGQGGVSS